MSTYSIVTLAADKLDPYLPFIYAKWLRSLRYGNEYFRLVHPESYWRNYQVYIKRLISQADSLVRLALLTEAPDVALGFSVSRGTILDYIYVQKDMRKIGIGASLMPKNVKTISHLTRTGASIWGGKMKDVIFNPFV